MHSQVSSNKHIRFGQPMKGLNEVAGLVAPPPTPFWLYIHIFCKTLFLFADLFSNWGRGKEGKPFRTHCSLDGGLR